MYTQEEKNEVVVLAKSKQAKIGESQSDVARKLKLSAATITNMYSGKWNNIGVDVWDALAGYAEYRQQWKLAEIMNYKIVAKVCNTCRSNAMAMGISEDAGYGKTATLRAVARNERNTFLLECEEIYTKKSFLRKLSKEMGLNVTGTIEELMDAIVKKVKTLDSPLILIDEVDMLKDNVMQLFKTLYNKLEEQCGFVLAGGLHFLDRIKKGVDKNKQAYKEIYSRLGGELLRLEKVSDADIRLICEKNGLKGDEAESVVKKAQDSDLRRVKALVCQALIKKGVSKR